MNESEYETLAARLRGEEDPPIKRVSPSMLSDQSDRVLLHGYTVNRDTFTIWLRDGLFVASCYGSGQRDDPPVAWRSASPEESRYAHFLVPNKRIYPAKSDAEFLTILHENGAVLSLANWSS